MPELNLDKDKFPLETYEPLQQIGRGGSGEVFLCRNRILGNQVAVKTLRVLTPDLMLELQQEARTSCKLNHPNLISVLDFGATTGGYPFLVMEYVSGVGLSKIISQEGRLPVSKALEIMILVLNGLGYAHSKGILHRDISANNVLVGKLDSETPMVKVIDFGAALSRIAGFETITSQGKTIIGTPAYMSPDTALGHRYSQTSELYSVGCVMFEALTGRVPFPRDNPLAILSAHAEEEPPALSEVVPEEDFPEELEAIVAKCLQKSPGERYQSAHRLKVELQSVLKELSAPSHEGALSPGTIHGGITVIQKRFKRKAGVSMMAAIISVAVVVIASVFLLKGEAAANQAAAIGAPAVDLMAEMGNPFACVIAGRNYQEGRSVPKDSKRAFALFKKAADADVTSGIYYLGNCYRHGIGVTANPGEAYDLFLKAANRSFALAERSMGEMQNYGEPVKEDMTIDWFSRAAQHGDPLAKSLCGVRIIRDQNIQDLREWQSGLRLIEEAAQADCTPAQFSIGLCHEAGIHTPIDNVKATNWYKRAAKKGDSDAQVRLGLLIENGKSATKESLKKAFRLYEKSARKGNLQGKLALSHCYRNGIGTISDTAMADNIIKEVENAQNEKTFAFIEKKDLPRIEAPAFKISTDADNKSAWSCRDCVSDNDLILLQQVNNVRDLDLSRSGFIRGRGLVHISGDSLVEFALSNVDSDTIANITRLSNISTLFLNLNDDGKLRGSDPFKPINLEPVRKLPKLRELRIQCKVLTPSLVSFLSSLDKLETLVIDVALGIENNTETQLFSKLRNLKTIYISVPILEGNTLDKLTQIRSQNFGLILTHCSLESADNLAKLKVGRLELKEPAVSDNHLPIIAKIPTLKAVKFIGSSQITAAGLAKLKSLRPDLAVEFERGVQKDNLPKMPW